MERIDFNPREKKGKRKEKEPNLQSPSEFLVQQETRELSSARALQKLDKDLPHRTLQLFRSCLELRVSHKVSLVVIRLELSSQGFELSFVQVLVHLSIEHALHLIEIRGIKPGSQQCILGKLLGPFLRLVYHIRRHHRHSTAITDSKRLPPPQRQRSKTHPRRRTLRTQTFTCLQCHGPRHQSGAHGASRHSCCHL